MGRFRKKIILLVILALGLFLRIYDLGTESLWEDEGISIKIADLNMRQIIAERASDLHPPLYFILLHYWINVFGNSEFSSRFLSVLFAFLAISVIYRTGKALLDKETGLISSFLLATSVYHIRYSQEARMYSLMTLLALLSMYFFLGLLRKKARPRVLLGYILSSILLMYTHTFGLFIILVQNIYVITQIRVFVKRYKFNIRKWLLAQCVLIISYMPWIKVSVTQILRIQHCAWPYEVLGKPTLGSIIDAFIEYSGSSLLLVLFSILSLYPILMYKKATYRQPEKFINNKAIYLLLLWLSVPLILPFIISQFSAPIFIPYVMIGTTLPFFLLIANGIKKISNRYGKHAIIAAIFILSSLNITQYYNEVNKDRWREVTSYIDKNAHPEDLLLFNDDAAKDDVFNYYSHRTDLIKSSVKDIRNIENFRRVWLIVWSIGSDTATIHKTLNKSFDLAYFRKYSSRYSRKFSFFIEVYLFTKNET